MIDRAIFFDQVRKLPFPGAISQTQVAGCNALLDEAERRGFDFRWTAYCLATAYHETAHTMLPIAEYGRGKGKAYGEPINGKTYYGRGYVQLTWIKNYEKMGALLKADLVGNPELAMDPKIAAQVMVPAPIKPRPKPPATTSGPVAGTIIAGTAGAAVAHKAGLTPLQVGLVALAMIALVIGGVILFRKLKG
jgi:hypothetical protein